jgi:hypothetical protein
LASDKKIATKYKSAIYEFELHHEEHLVSNGNIGAFYRYADKTLFSKLTVGPISRSDGIVSSAPTEKLLSCNKYSLIIIPSTTVSSQFHPTSKPLLQTWNIFISVLPLGTMPFKN